MSRDPSVSVGEGPPTQVHVRDGQPASISFAKMRLVVVDGPDRGKELEIGAGTIRGGTFEGCDLVLTDKTVSRAHFEIETRKEGFVLRDLGSTNGIRVDGYRVGTIYLKPGLVFQAGRTSVRFQPLNERVQVQLSPHTRFGGALGTSVRMRELFAMCEKLAPTDITVLLQGETGTGKEVLARSLHEASTRKDGPFVVVDCGTLPRGIIAAELFGAVKGAYTGATEARRGAFDVADGGTVFLDEIGELPLDLQPALLRVLESGEVRPVGGNDNHHVDVRIIAATNRDLIDEVAKYRFREDLYFRIAVAKVWVPALRERREDIRLLVQSFLETIAANWPDDDPDGRPPQLSVAEDALALLETHAWPGNVRELRNVVERAVFLSDTGEVVADEIQLSGAARDPAGPEFPDLDLPFKDAKGRINDSFERAYLRRLMERAKGNVSEAARLSGVSRKHVRDLLAKHGFRKT